MKIHTQSELPTEVQVMNISVNLARISEWVSDDHVQRKKLIDLFLGQTDEYIQVLLKEEPSVRFKPTLDMFINTFQELKSQEITTKNRAWWAEKALTWANILQHRAKLA